MNCSQRAHPHTCHHLTATATPSQPNRQHRHLPFLHASSPSPLPHRHCTRASTNSGEDPTSEPDIIERWVGKLFGQQVLQDQSPGGLKRLDVPEMYPATTDAWVDVLLPEDEQNNDLAYLRQLLKNTQLEAAPLREAYNADRDGWTIGAFNECVNTYGAGLVVLETAGGAVCGGYNPRGWIGLGEDRDSIAAFLFTWPQGHTNGLDIQRQRPVKLPKVGGPSLAVVDKPESGLIQFGAEELKIDVGRRVAKTRLGSYYARISSTSAGRSLFHPEKDDPKGTEIVRLQCFVAEGSAEEWELDGIIWKTSKTEQ